MELTRDHSSVTKKMMSSMNGPHIALLKHTMPRIAMNSGDGPHSYVQNSSYQVRIHTLFVCVFWLCISEFMCLINFQIKACMHTASFMCNDIYNTWRPL